MQCSGFTHRDLISYVIKYYVDAYVIKYYVDAAAFHARAYLQHVIHNKTNMLMLFKLIDL